MIMSPARCRASVPRRHDGSWTRQRPPTRPNGGPPRASPAACRPRPHPGMPVPPPRCARVSPCRAARRRRRRRHCAACLPACTPCRRPVSLTVTSVRAGGPQMGWCGSIDPSSCPCTVDHASVLPAHPREPRAEAHDAWARPLRQEGLGKRTGRRRRRAAMMYIGPRARRARGAERRGAAAGSHIFNRALGWASRGGAAAARRGSRTFVGRPWDGPKGRGASLTECN